MADRPKIKLKPGAAPRDPRRSRVRASTAPRSQPTADSAAAPDRRGSKPARGAPPGGGPDRARRGGPPRGEPWRHDGASPRSGRRDDDRPGVDRPRAARPSGDRPTGERPRSDRPRSARPGDDRPQTDRSPADRGRTDRPQTDRARTDRARTDRARTEPAPADRPPADRPRTERPRADRPRDDRRREEGASRTQPHGDRRPTDRPRASRPPGGPPRDGPRYDEGPQGERPRRPAAGDRRRPQPEGRPAAAERRPPPPRADRPRPLPAAGRGSGPSAPASAAPRPRRSADHVPATPDTAPDLPAPKRPPPPRTAPPDAGERLSKRLAAEGAASRREADEWIAAGWVRVDGQPAVLGQRVLPEQRIELDPAARREQAKLVTILLHKPVGFVSGQPEDDHLPAAGLVRPENRWADERRPWHPGHAHGLAPAGRLDIDSTGLLVLTQDGRVARRLIGEDSPVEKEYLVRVEHGFADGVPETVLERLRHGLELDGRPLQPAKVSWANEDQLRFVLREGRKRQIRRMCELVGLKVTGLKRVRIGSVVLGKLPLGQWRYLRDDEQF